MASTFSQSFVLHVTRPLWSGGETRDDSRLTKKILRKQIGVVHNIKAQ